MESPGSCYDDSIRVVSYQALEREATGLVRPNAANVVRYQAPPNGGHAHLHRL